MKLRKLYAIILSAVLLISQAVTSVSAAAPENPVTELKSSRYWVNNSCVQISQIPENTNSSKFLSVMSMDNMGIDMMLTESDKATPVFDKAIDDTMFLKAKLNGAYAFYSLKTGISINCCDDFKHEKTGIFKGDNVFTVYNTDNAYADIDNETLIFRHTTDSSVIMQTQFMNFSGGVVVSFDCMFNGSGKNMLFLILRDNNANFLHLSEINISAKTVKCFPGKKPTSVSVSEGIHKVTFIIDADGRVKCYADCDFIAELSDYRVLLKNPADEFDFSKLLVRITSEGDTDAQIDNIVVGEYSSEGVFCSDTKLYAQASDGTVYGKNTISDSMSVETFLYNYNEAPKKITAVAALYNDDILSSVPAVKSYTLGSFCGEKVTVQAESNKTGENSALNMYFWETDTNMPYRKQCIHIKSSSEAPSIEELADLFADSCGGEHPRLMAKKDDFTKIAEQVKKNEQMAEWYSQTIKNADNICANVTTADEDIKSPYYIGYTKELNDGLQILEISRRVKSFVTDLSMAYRLTKETKYSDCVWEIMCIIGKQDTEVTDKGFPDWDPSNFLDTAEMAAGAAIGYDWCYDAFEKYQRDYISETIKEYAIDASNLPNAYTWYKRDTANWNAVCNSCIIIAASAIYDVYPDECGEAISGAVESLKYSISNSCPDGAWQEGTSYAEYAMKYLTQASASMVSVFGSNFGIMDVKGLESIGDYFMYLDGPTGANNYNDSAHAHIYDSFMMYLSAYYSKPEYTVHIMKNRRNNGVAGGALDMLWYKPEYDVNNINMSPNKYFKFNEVCVMGKSFTDENKPWLSFQGGFGKNGHGHLDTGSFVYDCDGIRWACDLGYERYASGYSSKRYDYYRARAEGHNTIVINPSSDGGQSLSAYSKIIGTDFESSEPSAVLDMSGCYPNDAKSVRRSFKMLENEKGVVIRDEISLKSESTVYSFMHTEANAKKSDANTVILERNGIKKKVMVFCNTDFKLSVVNANPLTVVDPEFVCEGYPNPTDQKTNGGYKKIMLKTSGDKNVVIELVILSEGEEYNGFSGEMQLQLN